MVPIDTAPGNPPDPRLIQALRAEESSTRLKAALAAGTHPHPDLLEALVARCGVEPDFFVRDMLTWALTRLPAALTVPRLRAELGREPAQARSQALHTLSKIRDGSAYPAITRSLLRDPDDEVARAAWRAAVTLVPDGERERLAVELASQLGRGGRTVRLSLSRALVDLGEVIEPVLRGRLDAGDPTVSAHARATELLLHDPEVGFDEAVAEATRIVALGPGRGGAQAC
ncbi:HEAT repeat domain-containing protein [Micromonospora sp. NPDC000207]|uniref:HEAT repeat domain-containing protein n=1 Tax=Micromonospora sp. NPDC000207 TaxID=3154246 RepID=UPI00332A9CF6